MNEIETTTTHMQALKALSDTNLKVSEARNVLSKLQEEETEYLVSREKKALDRIQVALEKSHSLVEETNKNYEIINDFAKSISEGSLFLSEARERFVELVAAKDQKYQLWENSIKQQEETIISLSKGLKIQAVDVESARSVLEAKNRKLQEDTLKFKDERGIVERQISRLKEQRI